MNIDNLVLTTRIRLARNIDGIPFENHDKKLFEQIAESIKAKNPRYFSCPLSELDSTTQNGLFEQHIISKDFLNNTETGIIVTRNDNKISIMLGEEDHIRIQSIDSGLNLPAVYKIAKEIADKLPLDFRIAYDKDLGFLTKCPTNLGGGLRASVMIYLPALTLTGEIQKAFANININGDKITIRGVYGEGSKSFGCIYQISNQNCLFLNDQEILSLVNSAVNKIASIEFNLQSRLFKETPDEIIDKIMRAWGILTNARLISNREAGEQLVWIKLGVCLKILAFKNDRIIDDLFFITKPATLITNARAIDCGLSVADRDKLRADQIREKLLSFRIK
jgi:protein arginine kinase